MLTTYEKETIINFNEEESLASVYTYNAKLRRKLKELCDSGREDIECVFDHTDGGAEFMVPKKWIKVSPPSTRTLTPEQKEAAVQRLQAARKSKREASGILN